MHNVNNRLRLIMFFQLFSSGALTPILSLYLSLTLKFNGTQTGMILAMSMVSSVIAPLAGTFIADRLINSERLVGAVQSAGSLIMIVLAFQKDFTVFLALYLIYSLVIGPTMSLTNTIVLHHQPDAKKNYGLVRVWGTIGWIAAAWAPLAFGLRPDTLRISLILSAVSSLIMGIFSFTLPLVHTRLDKHPSFLPVESLSVIVKPGVLIVLFISMLVNLVDRYYYFGMAPFLKTKGFADGAIMPLMSIGQVPEIIAMAVIGQLLSRFSMKTMLAAGVFMEFLRFAVFASGGPMFVMIAALAMHGLTYVFYSVVVLIYLDGFCGKKTRAGVQQIFSIFAMGIGSLLGNICAGVMMDMFRLQDTSKVNFTLFWAVPAALSALIFVLIIACVNGSKSPKVLNCISGSKGSNP